MSTLILLSMSMFVALPFGISQQRNVRFLAVNLGYVNIFFLLSCFGISCSMRAVIFILRSWFPTHAPSNL